MFKQGFIIPPGSELINKILLEFHSSPIGGHSRAARTIKRISKYFCWPKMNDAITTYVSNNCKQVKPSIQKPMGLIMPLPIPQEVWEDISVDFITGLHIIQGKYVIIVVVDRLSKFYHFGALKSTYTVS